MSSRLKRSSILKRRPSVDPGSLEASPSEATTTARTTKRIGFKPKKSVKEFFASDETATIWCNSYELSADGTPPCLVINDDTTLKNASEMEAVPSKPMERCQGNKENLVAVEDRRSSCSESIIWDLSISAYEDEKRRVKSENSINSSVLNMTERLVQDPVSQTRQVLSQRQDLGTCEDSSAMDISPAKLDGKLSSPKKILYHHPKQNMFVSIDVNEKQQTQQLDDSDINFFGPHESQPVAKNTRSSKILFQTSTTPNQWRNKSIQTEPRPSAIEMRSTAVNADLSAGWNSHAAASEPFGQRSTFGNSQFEISEAWNSHPAAALKLKMLQQGLKSTEFDPRLSDGGGGQDVDTTLAITQTVAKMLGPGSRPASLDNTRLGEPEPMDVTKRRENQDKEAEMETSAHMDIAEDATISDVLIPANGLSRARPSFIPSATPMDQSDSLCSSPEELKSVSKQRRKADQRGTILKTVPIEASDLDPGATHVASPPDLSVRRQTIVREDNIVEDDPFLNVPEVKVKTPPRSAMRHTVYESRMDQSPAEREPTKGVTTPMIVMEPVKIDFPDLVFVENSFGLDLVKSSESQQQETNRPKIHRISSRSFKFGFNAVGTTQAETQHTPKAGDLASIDVDSPDTKPVAVDPSRKTVHAAADISLDMELLNDSKKSAMDPRRTEFPNQDVSMDSTVSKKPSPKRTTVFMNDNLNESHQSPQVEAPQPTRATMFFNEKLSQSCLEPRSGSLEDLRNYGQSRRTVQRIEAMDCVSADSPKVVQANTLRNKLSVGDMDQSALEVKDDQFNRRLTSAAAENMDVTARRSPHATEVPFETKNQRETISFNTDMDQSICTRKSSPLKPPSNKQKSRQTIIGHESMDQTLIDGRAVTVQEFKQSSQRSSVFCEANMDETSVATRFESPHIPPKVQESRLTSHHEAAMDETCKTTAMLDQTGHQTLQLSKLVAETPIQESYPEQQSRRSVFKEADMDETATRRCDDINEQTIRQSLTPSMNDVDPSKALTSLPKKRHTSCAEEDIDETLSPARKLEATLLERSRVSEQLPMPKPRTTVHQEADMDETRFGTPPQTKCESIVPKPCFVNQMLSPTRKETLRERSRVGEQRSMQNPRTTVHQEADMDETRDGTPLLSSAREATLRERSRIGDQRSMQNIRITVYHDTDIDDMRDGTPPISSAREATLRERSRVGDHRSMQNLRITVHQDTDMDETHAETPSLSLARETTLWERSKIADHRSMQHPRNTVYQEAEMDETSARTPTLQEQTRYGEQRSIQNPRSTVYQDAHMDETCAETVPVREATIRQQSRVGEQRSLQNLRITVHQDADMDETRAETPPLSLARETTLWERSKIADQRSMKNPRNTVYQEAEMDETSARTPMFLEQTRVGEQRSIQNPKTTVYQDADIDETCAETVPVREATIREQSRVYEQRSIQNPRNTVYQEADMDDTRARTPPFSPVWEATVRSMKNPRNTVHQDADMDETVGTQPISTTREATLLEQTSVGGKRSMQNPRTTVYQEVDMDETRPVTPPQSEFKSIATKPSFVHKTLSPDRKLEATFLEQAKAGQQPSFHNPRTTVHQEGEMDEMCTETPPQAKHESIAAKPSLLVYRTIDLTTSPQHSIIHLLPNKSRLTVPAMDQTISLEDPTEPVNIALPARYTTYKQDSMEETTVAASLAPVNISPKSLQAKNGLKQRRTVSCEQDMDQTVGAPQKRVLTVEMDDNGRRDGDGVDVQEVTTRLEDRRVEVDEKGDNGTIRPDMTIMNSMDVSVIKFSSVPLESTHNSRRTIIQSVNIAEDPVKCEIKIEQSQSILNTESPTHTFKQEQQDKSDFSFVVPQLPDDCVLRSAAPVPVYRSNQTLKTAPQLSQPECINESITEPSFFSRKISPLADVSELSEKAELSYGSGRRPVMPSGNVSVVLKEVTEPPIVQPAVPVSVIQETPKKPSIIPVRMNRGSIFDRVSMDLDESGIVPILSQEQAADCQSEGNDQYPRMTAVVKNDPPCPTEVLIKNEHVIESSDDEFFDAVPGSTSIDEPDEEIVCVTREAIAHGTMGRGGLKFTKVNDLEPPDILDNQATVGCKTLKFIDMNDLEQTAVSNQKRQLSRISKSVLLEQDPLNASLTDDYPMKKRKTKIPTPVSKTKIQSTERTTRRVTFHQDLLNSEETENNKCLEVETVIIKDEPISIIDDETYERSKFGQTLLTDPSVFIIEESDMLANESNISLVKSPSCENINRGSTLKLDNTYYNDYVNLTLHIDQVENGSCIVISDDSVTVPTSSKTQELKSLPPEQRLTLKDLPSRISKTRESLVLNSTVASEVMYELKQQVSQAGKGCCSFEGNCNCRNRRTMAAVKRDNVEAVREMWNQNFDRILESVSEIPKQDVPLDTRICEILSRPIKPLPLPCMEKQTPHLPETPSIWFLCENYMRSLQISDTQSKVYNPCDLPAIPSTTALISNKLETEGYRWLLDVSEEFNMRLYLRHRILRSVRFKIQLQKTKRWYSKEEDVRIARIEFVENRNDLVRSARLLIAHLEFVRAMDKITVDHLCSRNPTTAHMMRLIEHLDSVIEPIFSKVDQLYRIVRSNGAILEKLGNDDQLVIHKYYEYQHNGVIHWNRLSVHFNAIDRIDHQSVAFHRKMLNADCLFPTEHQCGRVDIQGLIFLECFLWNVEKISFG